MTIRRAAALLLFLAVAGSLPAQSRTPPSRMMANVYLLAQAGAILDICLASPEFPTFPSDKARALLELSTRLTEVVRSVGTYYGDDGLDAVYASTKAEIASDPKLRFHVKSNHRDCGERLMSEMRTYVTENESLIGDYIHRPRPQAPRK